MKHILRMMQESTDFTTLYLGIKNLVSIISENSYKAENNSFLADKLFNLLKSNNHENQTRSFFLYREIGDVLINMLENSDDDEFKKYCTCNLEEIILKSGKDKLRAVGDSISKIKLDMESADVSFANKSEVLRVSIEDVIEEKGLIDGEWYGRSLILKDKTDNDKLVVFKFLRKEENLEDLINEIRWMKTLKKFESSFFSVPTPLFEGAVSVSPSKNFFKEDFHLNGCAIVFAVGSDYYRYPNEKSSGFNEDKLMEVMGKNAYLTGFLTGKGIIHNALIPLFHNTVQKERRDDCGLYMWEKGGRLDNWLGSCKYPNFGFSGLRDFEHMELFTGNTKTLYRNIGNHLLGFILVLGSFFRKVGSDGSRNNGKVGKKGFYNGQPMDARELFKHSSFKKVFYTVLSEYIRGFAGENDFKIPVDDTLIENLIESMGCDKNMEEIIRMRDQKTMDGDEFRNLLISKNIDDVDVKEKGKEDIVVNSGPHLGEFNGKISVPELTEFIIKASSLSILKKCSN